LAPDKYLLLSTHGDLFAERLPPVSYKEYKRHGYYILSINAEGENVCTSYQSREYSVNLFSQFFELLGYFPSALEACGNQDLYLLKKKKLTDS
jgi:hypothetical protein